MATKDDWIPSLRKKKDRPESSSDWTRGRNNRHCSRMCVSSLSQRAWFRIYEFQYYVAHEIIAYFLLSDKNPYVSSWRHESRKSKCNYYKRIFSTKIFIKYVEVCKWRSLYILIFFWYTDENIRFEKMWFARIDVAKFRIDELLIWRIFVLKTSDTDQENEIDKLLLVDVHSA